MTTRKNTESSVGEKNELSSVPGRHDENRSIKEENLDTQEISHQVEEGDEDYDDEELADELAIEKEEPEDESVEDEM